MTESCGAQAFDAVFSSASVPPALDLEQFGASVVVRDRPGLLAKLAALQAGGPALLEVLSDFDRTLTFQFNSDGIAQSSYYMLYESNVFSSSLKDSCLTLFHKYYPIETDPHRPEEEKLPLMLEWWNAIHDLILAEKPTWPKIQLCAQLTKSRLRTGVPEMLQTLSQHGVPVRILSAGLGDMIVAFLQHNGAEYPENTTVRSNFMEFGSDGVARRFVGVPVTTFSKTELLCASEEVCEDGLCAPEGGGLRAVTDAAAELSSRSLTNVLLLGDSLSDIRMAVPGAHNTVLSVGFLNDRVEESLSRYSQAFDIVLLHDCGAELVNHLLAVVLGGHG
eukprot:RCo036866